MNTFPKGETALKVKLTNSNTKGFKNPDILEETKIDLDKLPDDDKVKDESNKVKKCEEQAKKSAEKETTISNNRKDVNPASDDAVKETINQDIEGVNEGDNKVAAKCSSVEAVDDMSMEGNSTVNPAVNDHKDLNIYHEDNEAEGTKN